MCCSGSALYNKYYDSIRNTFMGQLDKFLGGGGKKGLMGLVIGQANY